MLLTVFGVTGPIFLIILTGYLAARLGPLRGRDARVLGVFVIDFALPALLFRALSQRPLGQLLHVDLLWAYTLGTWLVMVLVVGYQGLIRRQGLQKGALLAMGMTLSNSAFMGFPIAESLFGPVASANLAVYLTVENMIMIPSLIAMAELGRKTGSHWSRVLQGIVFRLFKNPLILAIAAGAAFSALQIHVPPSLQRVIDLLAAASSPVALFYIGAILAGLGLGGKLGGMTLLALGKLILHPLAVFAALTLLSFPDPSLKLAAVINAGMPMATVYPLLGQKYGWEGFCAAALVLTTLLAFFTLSLLIGVLQTG